MKSGLHGVMAEFESPDDVLAAARSAYDAGYRKLDAYSPFPVEGLSEAVGFHHTWLPWIVLCGGITGALTGFFLQYYVAAIDYPLNIGGRPLNSWPYFIPVTFELTILFSALSAVIGMIVLNGLPRPYHPVFNVPGFSRASRNRFFICIEAADPGFDYEKTKSFLKSLNAVEVSDVEP
jgi:hypothetical protein